MKSYTDLNQSKKLAEILPLKSADMCFNISQRHNMPPLMTPYSKFNKFFNMETPDFLIPCWSLAALLNVLPYPFLSELSNEIWKCGCYPSGICYYVAADSPIDACYEMIIKLHELKML